MARRRKRPRVPLSLFPFLSVLSCAMGVMIMIISGQNLLAVGSTADQYLEVVGTAQDKEPRYVECHAQGVTLLPDKTEVVLEALSGPGPSSFHQLLDEIEASGGKKSLVLLVRPEGIKAYQRCFYMAYAERKIRAVGKDAILSGGQIVLTKEGKPLLKKGAGP